MTNKYKRINYLFKKDAINQTINDALSLKDDLNNFAIFKDNSTNQLFFVATEEQLYKTLNKLKLDLKLKDERMEEEELKKVSEEKK